MNADGLPGWRLRWTHVGGGEQQSRIFYGTEVAASQELARLSGRRAAVTVSRRRVTLYNYLDEWQALYRQRCERQAMSRSSWKEHEANVRLYLRPTLEQFGWKGRRLASFESDELVELVNTFSLASGKSPSESMRRSVRKTLVMALGQAVKDGIIAINPLEGQADWSIGTPTVFVPDPFQVRKVAVIMGSMPSLVAAKESKKKRDARLKARREGKSVSPPPRVREGEPRPWLEWMLMTAAWTGLRIGELLALRLQDVDLSNRVIKVRLSATVSGGRFREGKPKTESGVRLVPILPDAEEPIRKLYDRAYTITSNPTHLFVGAGRRASRLNDDGKRETVKRPGAIGYSELAQELREACRLGVKQGVIPEPFTWHALRHTFCSVLISASVSETKVATWAGHSSPQVTKTIYSVALPGNMEALAAETGEKVFEYFGNRGQSSWEKQKDFKRMILEHNPDLADVLKDWVSDEE